VDYRSEAPKVLFDFLNYLEAVLGKSPRTINEYYLDLRLFLRYLKQRRGLTTEHELSKIAINDLDLNFVASVTLADVYDFLAFLSRRRPQRQNSPTTKIGIESPARARKVSAIRAFYKYLSSKAHLIENDPMVNLDSPKQKKTVVRYLSLDESKDLLSSVKGINRERDYCILLLFLSCGLRVNELVGLNLGDIGEDSVRVLGKGNKERVLILSPACREAIDTYLSKRIAPENEDRNALFISRKQRRIDEQTVKWLVKKYITSAGLDPTKYSAHKLRHTAATLMYQNGVDVRTLQEVLGHEQLNTTQIYTHVDNENLRVAARANPLSTISENDYIDINSKGNGEKQHGN